MRIDYFVNYFPPNTGAAAVNALEITNQLASFGNEVRVFVPKTMGSYFNVASNNFPLNSSVQILQTPVKFPGRTSYVFSHFTNALVGVREYGRSSKPDLILTQYHPFHMATPAGYGLGRFRGIPVVGRSHDLFLDVESKNFVEQLYSEIIYSINFRVLRKLTGFYSPTQELRDYLASTGKVPDCCLKIHRNGVNTELFHPEAHEHLKERYSCEKILYFVGGIQEDVGLHNFIKAMAELQADFSDFICLIVGDGPERPILVEMSKNLGIERKVVFLGSVPHRQLPELVNGMDVGIGRTTKHHMHHFIAPIKCLEYMACAKPFISTPVSTDVINDNNTGLLLESIQPKHIAEQVLKLFEDPALCTRLGRTGRQIIEEKFEWDRIMREFAEDLQTYV